MPPKRKLSVGNNGNFDLSVMFKKQGKLLLSEASCILGRGHQMYATVVIYRDIENVENGLKGGNSD